MHISDQMLREDDRAGPPRAERTGPDEPTGQAEPGGRGVDWTARAEDVRQLARERRDPAGPSKGRAPGETPPARRPDNVPERPGKPERPDKSTETARDDAKPDRAGRPDPETDEKSEDRRSMLRKVADFVGRHPLGVALGAVVLVAAIVAGILWYLSARHWESTDDAFIDARSFAVAPKVSGYIADVLVTDNQHVSAGDVIARINPRDYQVALEQVEAQGEAAAASVTSAKAQVASQQAQVEEAQAQVVQQEAALKFATLESERAQELVRRGAGTVERAQQTASELRQAQANLARAQASEHAAERQVAVVKAQEASAAASLDQAQAQLAQAKLNLSYTTVTADQPGRVVRLSGAKGQLAQAGQAIAMFVPDELWVTANFKETQLTDMRPGQPVEMEIDAYPGRDLRGHVESVQPGSGTAFSLLPAQNATGNYVKVVQRVPVKIVFDELPTDVTIGPGMSVVPRVRVR